jgi:cytochrome c oxidase subunit 2
VSARRAGLAALGVAVLGLLSGCGTIGDAADGFGWPEGGITDRSERMYDMWVGSVIAGLVVGLVA